MKKFILSTLISLAIAGSAAAQSPKGAEQLRTQKAPAADKSNVDGKFQILSSHIKSLGTIGKTDRYEIVAAKIRGIDSPNVTALLVYDRNTDTLGSIASGVEPGLGVAIVNGAATVGGNFLFGASLRPDRTSVSNNSDSDSRGGNSAAISKSEGGDAVSLSSSKSDSDASAGAIAASSSTSSVKNSNSNSNSNSNRNEQSQGQVQGQQQGQTSVNQNANANLNSNSNSNANKNKAPKSPKQPKKTKKHGNN